MTADAPMLHSTLQAQIDEFKQQLGEQMPPEFLTSMLADIATLVESSIVVRSLHLGERAPDFSLLDAEQRPVSLAEILRKGTAVVTFYRGDWCPMCDLQLRSYQRILQHITAQGATLVAISPQDIEWSFRTVADKQLTFPILSDTDNQIARQYGLVYKVNDTLRAIQRRTMLDAIGFSVDDSWELPLPGTFVIDRNQIVRLAFVDADYTQRLEPSRLLSTLRGLTFS